MRIINHPSYSPPSLFFPLRPCQSLTLFPFFSNFSRLPVRLIYPVVYVYHFFFLSWSWSWGLPLFAVTAQVDFITPKTREIYGFTTIELFECVVDVLVFTILDSRIPVIMDHAKLARMQQSVRIGMWKQSFFCVCWFAGRREISNLAVSWCRSLLNCFC